MHKIILVGTLGRVARTQESAVNHSGPEASVPDQVNTRATGCSCAEATSNSAAMADASADAKAFATLQARFALHGWQLDPDPGIDGRRRYIVTRWGHMRVLNSIDDVRALQVQIRGAQ